MALAATGLQTHIWNNNAKSILLLAGYPLLILLMLWAFFASIDFTGSNVSHSGLYAMQPGDPIAAGFDGLTRYWHIALGFTAIWFTIAWFFHQSMINRATGARAVSRTEEPRIYNLLENLCISRGMRTPKLCIIDSHVLNAYASGLKESNYTVTLTRGIIDALDDHELEAVIAHELSHIRNNDVRLLVISVIFVGMISFFAEMAFRSMLHGGRMGYRMARNRHSSRNGGAVVLIALVILGVGYLFSLLIRFALSRKREYLADAGAVELTKNPDAMISALRKISDNATMPNVPDEVKQMFIENPPSFIGIFATHPPIDKRIEALVSIGGRDHGALPTNDGPWS